MNHQGDCDVLVIGSGFGGAVCALRIAQAGARVVILERGRRLRARGVTATTHGRIPALGRSGLLDLKIMKGLVCLSGNAVGGSSNLYTAVTIRPPDDLFDRDWPSGFNAAALAPHYDRVESTIRPSVVPVELPRMRALQAISRKLGQPMTTLPLSAEWPSQPQQLAQPNDRGALDDELSNWLQGGGVGRKKTLNDTYLSAAMAAGADIRPRHEVTCIRPHGEGFLVQALRRKGHRVSEVTLQTRRVVITAGTLNTLRLLLHCRDVAATLPKLSRALGERFFTNGDMSALLARPAITLEDDCGPPVSAWIDVWQPDRCYLMETGIIPYGLPGLGLAGLTRAWHRGPRPEPRRNPRGAWSFAVMGYCDSPGRIVLHRSTALAHISDHRRARPFIARSRHWLRELASAAGARLWMPPAAMLGRMPATVHPLGGAALADSPQHGVANPHGEVYGHPGLYIADGSLLPTPTGAAPSMTIAALAEHVAHSLLREYHA